ncbi:fluoride efflux transporter CrcB [Enterococcus sp.]|uniref:fluoride efflux transporter CrcB n=1 Tax=Enterococcus sp. TaxID=35783 RepID=UPI002FC7FAB0
MTLLLLITLGGGIGAVLRYIVTVVASKYSKASYVATLIVNVSGSFLMGIGIKSLMMEPTMTAFLLTGILGGFTTFSTFAFDMVHLLYQRKIRECIFYTMSTLTLGFIFVAIGYWL